MDSDTETALTLLKAYQTWMYRSNYMQYKKGALQNVHATVQYKTSCQELSGLLKPVERTAADEGVDSKSHFVMEFARPIMDGCKLEFKDI